MSGLKLLLLPGLDGDGFYFSAFKRVMSSGYDCVSLSYPPRVKTYIDLCEWVCDQLDTESDYIIIAESFGGPLGVLVAEALENQAKALVLCATFCEPPLPVFLIQLTAMLYPYINRYRWISHLLNFFLFNDKNFPLAQELHRILLDIPSHVIAHRLRLLCGLDMRPAASALDIPCLVLNASHDRLVRRGRFRGLQYATTAMISGPHSLMGMKPEAVIKAIGNFIKTVV